MDRDSGSDEPDVESLRSRPPGHEPEDPYEDVDVSTLPDWWEEAIRQFEAHGLRPFRPSRFEDGELTRDVVDRIEATFDVTVRIAGVDAEYGDDWTVFVDGDPVGSVARRRTRNGYTVFEVSSDEFESLICDALSGT